MTREPARHPREIRSEQLIYEAIQELVVAVRELAGVTTDAQAKAGALAAADNAEAKLASVYEQEA